MARQRKNRKSVLPGDESARPAVLNGVPVPYGVPASTLEALVRQRSRERWAALIALGHDPSEEALAAVARAARDPDPHVRRGGIEALALPERGHEASDVVLEGLSDVSAVVVRAACQAVSALGVQDGRQRLLELLADPEPATREVAVRALGSLWRAGDFETVLAVFRRERSDAVRKETAWVLRNHASAGTWRQLFEVWRTDAVHRHRLWACELASEFGGPDILPYVRELGRDRDGLVRRAAKRAAERLEAV